MKHVKTYATTGQIAPVVSFLDGLEPKFREKLIWQIFQLSHTPRSMLKEPHYKHFSIERYQDLYEIRERGKILVRIIFTFDADGDVLLLKAFVKHRKRDTMRALEQSLRILADIREHPEHAVEFTVKEEHK